ncbi:hypothetical protein ABIA51_004460 [Erwinia aphidicola]
MGLWDYGIMGLWDYGIMGLWDYGIMGLWDYGIIFSDPCYGFQLIITVSNQINS